MININELTYYYHKDKPVLEDINLSLDLGQTVGLIGRNGVGKSTLLKCIMGLLKAKKGTIRIGGINSYERSPKVMAQYFFIPEEIPSPDLSIGRYSKLYGPFYPAFSRDDLRSSLTTLELEEGQLISALSYGQRKKAILAFGLACNTAILILDEPTNGLDILAKGQFRQCMSAFSRPDRLTLISSHQVKDLEPLIDRIMVLEASSLAINMDLENLESTLHFGLGPVLPSSDELLYSVETFKGYEYILRRTHHSASKINLELLYKAILQEGKPFITNLNAN
jgi:ABC-2 type transport system ATP-binding protein